MDAQGMVQVVFHEHHQLFLQALLGHFTREPTVKILAGTSDFEAALADAKTLQPDILVVDCQFTAPGAMEKLAQLQREQPRICILFLADYPAVLFLEQVLPLPRSGILLKTDSVADLTQALHQLVRGQRPFSQLFLQQLEQTSDSGGFRLRDPEAGFGLTRRQCEVLRLLALGESVKEVAHRLHLSQKSVDSHKYRIMNKLGIHDRVALTRFAIREGIIEP